MNETKVILISVDGMRPDGFLNCNNPSIGWADDAERLLYLRRSNGVALRHTAMSYVFVSQYHTPAPRDHNKSLSAHGTPHQRSF